LEAGSMRIIDGWRVSGNSGNPGGAPIFGNAVLGRVDLNKRPKDQRVPVSARSSASLMDYRRSRVEPAECGFRAY